MRRGTLDEQQKKRMEVVDFLCRTGSTHRKAAVTFQLSVSAVDKIWVRYKTHGKAGLQSRKRGPKAGHKLTFKCQCEVLELLKKNPEELELPYLMWSRQAAVRLLSEQFGCVLSSWQMGRYLRAWGCEPAFDHNIRRSSKSLTRWSHMGIGYSDLRKKAAQEGAVVVHIHLSGSGHAAPGIGRKQSSYWISAGYGGRNTYFMWLGDMSDTARILFFFERLMGIHRRKIYGIWPELSPNRLEMLRQSWLPHKGSMVLVSAPSNKRTFLEDCPGPGGYYVGAPCLDTCPYAWVSSGLPCEAGG